MTTIAFPRHERPLATVVIPVHGQEAWTRHTLEAVREHTAVPYDVVVVDDASPDDTGERLARDVEGAVVLRNERNVGFSATCNRGALAARGRHLVFLNSDAMPHAGWLEPLLAALSRPRAGAAGPRIVNLDGTLQQAGALIGGDGRTTFYGHGDDPNAAEYAFSRVVDYVSGACLAIRRPLFAMLGGFDAAYGAGYYEDVDLCLRLADRGFSTWYVPDSLVTHVHRASSTEADAVALSEHNRRALVVRRRPRLAGRPELDLDRRSLVAARDAPVDGCVLVVGTSSSPQVDRLLGLIRRTRPRVRTTVLCSTVESDARPEIELAAREDVPAFLEERMFAFDAVVVADDAADGLRDAIERTQPQAAIVEARSCDDLDRLLLAAGLPSES